MCKNYEGLWAIIRAVAKTETTAKIATSAAAKTVTVEQ